MTSIATAVVLGVTLFVATNIDDIFVLLGFFSDPKFRARQVVLGQFLGIGVLVLVSIVAALVALVFPAAYIGLLGLAPIGLGLKKLLELRRGESDADKGHEAAAKRAQAVAVAAVTMANGGDNIAVYTPVFAVQSGVRIAVIVAAFAVMTAVWCGVARWLVQHRTIGAPIRAYGHRVLPFVLIGLGIYILVEAGTLGLLRKL